MKWYLISAVAALCLSAPINSIDRETFSARQGSIWLGGSFGFSTTGLKIKDTSVSNPPDTRINMVTFSPTLRFFPINYFVIGPKLSWMGMFYHTSSSDRYQINSSLHTWGLGGELGLVYGSKFVIPYLFAAPQASIVRNEGKYESSSTLFSDSDENLSIEHMFVLPLSGGAIFPVGKNLGIQFETGIKFRFHEDFTMNTFFIGIGICGLGEKVVVSMVNIFSPFDAYYY